MNRHAVVALGRGELLRASSRGARSSVVDAALHLVGRSGVCRAARSISCRSTVLRVADDADLDRIDLADLLRVDVDLDQPRAAESRRCARAATSCSRPRRTPCRRPGPRRRRASCRWRRACPRCRVIPQRQRMIFGQARPWPSASSPPASPAARPAPCSSSAASESTTPLPAKIAGDLRRLRAAARRRRSPSGAPAGAAVVGPPARHLLRRRLDVLREHVHRDVEQHRARTAGLRHVQRARHHVDQELRVVDAPHALADRPVDVALRRVGVEAGCPGAARARGGRTACCR